MKFFKLKSAKSDFTKSMLPHNRKQVFSDVVKLHWKELLILGFVALIFSLPLLFSQVMQDNITAGIINALPDSPTEEQFAAARADIVAYENTRAFINIIFLLLFSVALSGILRVVRQYAWEENVSLSADFFAGVKQNLGQISLVALISGVIYALCVLSYNLSSMASGVSAYLFIIPVGVSLLVALPVAGYTLAAVAVYSNKFIQNVKAAFTVYAQNPFKALLATLCCMLVFIPQYIPDFYCHVFGRMISSLLCPFVLLGWLLFCFNRFDKKINAKFFPELVGKGTFDFEDEK